jgi:glycosyltransferase involved in cell wall biosynthesis
MIRILHVVSVDKENYYLNNLVDYSSRSEVEYSFVTLARKNCEFVRDLKTRGCNVVALDTLSRIRYPEAIVKLRELYKSVNPDIVHTHLFDPSLLGLTVAKRQNRRTVSTRHHSDAIHQIASPLKRRFYLGLENYISRKSDHIIAPSRMVREYLVDYEGVADGKVSVIPYGQTTDRYDSVTKEKIGAVRRNLRMDGNLSLVFVSRLFHRKGHIYLFKALAELTREGLNMTLYLVGDGEYQSQLEREADELGIAERIRFLGWRDDALAIIGAADIVVHPSLEDALSSAVIESLMMERPIVASDISGVRDSLDDGRYGTIVPAADADALKKGIQEILQNLEEARLRAKAGRQYLLNYMDAGRVAQAHVDLYRQLMA